MLDFKYIPVEKEQNLKTYAYSGMDNSVLYKYCLGPLADQCVKYATY